MCVCVCRVCLQKLSEHDEPVQRHRVSGEGQLVVSSLQAEQHQQTSSTSSVRSTHRSDGRGAFRTASVCYHISIYCFLNLRLLSLKGLMHSSGPVGRHRQLVLVLEGELYLIPFALLKGSSSNEYLYERFSLISVPSLSSLGAAIKVRKSYFC